MHRMSKEQVSIGELLLSLDSSDLQEAEQGRAAISHQLSSEKGGAVLSSLVDFYLNSSSCASALTLLSSIREPLHKALLDKLNEAVSRPASRLAAVTLLGHVISGQPPWIHHVSRSPLLTSLLRCLKSDGDVMMLVPGVLVIVTLLPMIPQAAKQHIYDFFDVFGRLASWSLKNPGRAPASHLVHLHAGAYALFHRLYGMFPCNFLSYLRLHYSMKENLDTFHRVVKPMLEHVRVHPELVSGTQDSEVDPSRWRGYEVHDIIVECSRVSLDPLESSCDERTLAPPLPTHLDQTCLVGACGSEDAARTHTWSLSESVLHVDRPDLDVTWSPSSQCGLSTPPPEKVAVSPDHPLNRNNTLSGDTHTHTHIQHICACLSTCLVCVQVQNVHRRARAQPQATTVQTAPGVQTFPRAESSPSGWRTWGQRLTMPLKEAQRKMATQHREKRDNDEEEDLTAASPLDLLDCLIAHGHDTHAASVSLSRRSSGSGKLLDCNPCAGGCAEDAEVLRRGLQLAQAQLQYERFKRQQHAIRNRRLLRRVVSAAALEERTVATCAQLALQDEETRALTSSLEAEQRRCARLRLDAGKHGQQLEAHVQHLLRQEQEHRAQCLALQSELQECQVKMRDLETQLQKARHRASEAERHLSRLSLKLRSSDELRRQSFLLNRQLIVLTETNKALTRRLDALQPPPRHRRTEASEPGGGARREFGRAKEAEQEHRQKLEAANHRAAELDKQLAHKETLVELHKELLDDHKRRSRGELSACEAQCATLRKTVQSLQSEMLHLYSVVDALSRPTLEEPDLRTSSSSVVSGACRLSTSPLLFPAGASSPSPLSPSPNESPLAIGSFLEQRAWQLFRPANHSPEEEAAAQPENKDDEDDRDDGEDEKLKEDEEVRTGSPGRDADLLAESPPVRARLSAPPSGPSPAIVPRRRELSIMDYDHVTAHM
ncbi:hamartin-like isoform X6 [Syngnathus typhle]|uniref:hamartin-like isoform X6 n=1 Tax=Syngnathus typhle TaxID=161592 RepID=UPI002A6AE84D|nr:hamartin-like isoform X6 [Syngnathus typhle]